MTLQLHKHAKLHVEHENKKNAKLHSEKYQFNVAW